MFEEPCRFGKGNELTKEFDQAVTAAKGAAWPETIQKELGCLDYVNVLEGYTSIRDETFPITDEILDECTKDADDVDLYVVTYFPFGIDLAAQIAKKTGKPFACILTGSSTGTGTVAALRARGCECLGWVNWDKARLDCQALLARKVMANLRILQLIRNNSTNSISAPDSFIDHADVSEKMGIRFSYMNLHEFIDMTNEGENVSNHCLPGRREANITPAEAAEIKAYADALSAGALEVDMPQENVYKSCKANYLARQIMAALGCNAFTAPCPDMCATRRLNEEQFTLCLNHSLNNEEGICSACEMDVSALVSMQLLSALSRTAPYMGNTMIVKYGADDAISAPNAIMKHKDQLEVIKSSIDGKGGIVCTYHSTAARNMKQMDEKGEYAIRPFAMDGRWGATIRYDFQKDAGQTVTIARFDPTCSKLFVARGTVVAGAGYKAENCSEGLFYTVSDIEKFAEGNMTAGNHMAVVYGDVLEAAKRYAELAGFEVIAVD